MFLRKCMILSSMILSIMLTATFGQSRWVWRNQLPQGYSLNAVTWTGTQFVAVGEACAILTSTDGVSWNVRPDNAFGDLYCVTSNGKISVACGTNQYNDCIFILSSADGTIWEQSYKNNSLREIHSMIWTGTQFAGICLMGEFMDSSALLRSADGTHWTVSPQTIEGRLNTLIWTGTQFVAVGSTGIGAGQDSCAIATSADGVAWTRTVTNVPGQLRTVVWTGTRLVAVGGIVDKGKSGFSRAGLACLKQSTCVNNKKNSHNTEKQNTQRSRSGGVGNIMTSTDGITWTRHYPDSAYPLNTVLWANGLLIAAGGLTAGDKDTCSLLTSSDGITWTPRQTNCRAVLYTAIRNGSVYIVYGSNGTILSSTDGAAWTPHVSPWCPEENPVQSNGKMMVSVGALGAIATSADGITWKEQSSGTGIKQPLKSVFWTGSQLVAVGASGRTSAPIVGNCILTSPDGITWTSRSPQVDKELYFVTGSPHQLLVVGDSGTILTSPDGSTWTSRVSGTNAPLYGAAWTGVFWIVVGESGVICTSTDGIEWKLQQSSLITEALYSIIWTGKHLLAAGIPGIFSSADGIVWTQRYQDLAVFGLIQTANRVIARVNFGLLTTVSTDDTTWSEPALTGTALGAMTSIEATTIARTNGRSGAMYTSTDGLKWKPVAANLFRSINSLTWTGKFLVAAGDHGAILTAPADSSIAIKDFTVLPSKKDFLHTFSMHTNRSWLYLCFSRTALKKPVFVSVYSLSGRTIIQRRGTAAPEPMAIPLPGVAAGVYLASVECDGQTFVRSFYILR